jgi:DNA-binding transcriptional ArsR family regulator
MSEFKPIESFLITDIETLKVITNPVRTQILVSLKGPQTVKQVAEKLDLPPSKLYYHVNLLEKHGLIAVVETRVVSNIIEKVYCATADNYEVDPALLSLSEGETRESANSMIISVLDQTREEFLRALQVRALELAKGKEQSPRRAALSRALCVIPESRVPEFQERIEALLQDFQAAEVATSAGEDAPDKGLQTYAMTVAFYPHYPSTASPQGEASSQEEAFSHEKDEASDSVER